MSPSLIFFAIRSFIRLGEAGRRALNDYASNQETMLIGTDMVDTSPAEFVSAFFSEQPYDRWTREGRYKDLWEEVGHGFEGVGLVSGITRQQIMELYAFALDQKLDVAGPVISDKDKESLREQGVFQPEQISNIVFLSQWTKEQEPLSPLKRVVVTMADIGLDYVKLNPSILNVGGQGEVLLRAFARNLDELIPETGEFGAEHEFAERVLSVFLRAGFTALSENTESLVPEAHWQQLLGNTLKPLMGEFEKADLNTKLNYRNVADTLLGPAANAAMTTLAGQPEKYLGSDFRSSKALGALTSGLLTAMAKQELSRTFTPEGLGGLYRAALQVAAQRPELFFAVDSHGDAEDKLKAEIFVNLIKALHDGVTPFDDNFASIVPQLGVAALEAVAANTSLFLDRTDEWEVLAARLTTDVLSGMATKLEADGQEISVASFFSRAQLIDLGRVFLNQVAATPGMVVGKDDDLKALVAAVAQAMAADQHLLLNGDKAIDIVRAALSELAKRPQIIAGQNTELLNVISAVSAAIASDEKLLLDQQNWIEIAKAAAAEAAANPARLFGAKWNDEQNALASSILKLLIEVGNAVIASPDTGPDKRSVLYGETLEKAVIILMRAFSGSPQAFEARADALRAMAQDLSEFVVANSDLYGSKEWLRLFRIRAEEMIKTDVANGTAASAIKLTTATANALLGR